MDSPIKFGYIYCLTYQEYYHKNVFKIGRTTKSVNDLVKRYKTYSPGKLILLVYKPVLTENSIENELKTKLVNYRLNDGGNEWFQVEPIKILTELKLLQQSNDLKFYIWLILSTPEQLTKINHILREANKLLKFS